MTKASINRVIIQSSTFEGAQELITQIMEQHSDVTATIPIRAADGSFLASVCISSRQTEIIDVVSNTTRIL